MSPIYLTIKFISSLDNKFIVLYHSSFLKHDK